VTENASSTKNNYTHYSDASVQQQRQTRRHKADTITSQAITSVKIKDETLKMPQKYYGTENH
jgi:hypothetical protein